ncbi:MAG: hypothetical protein IKQ10_10310 [Oscillospiraceae bacterium]|nr:hypothetical protein [Oscillospiraceae bacterium]
MKKATIVLLLLSLCLMLSACAESEALTAAKDAAAALPSIEELTLEDEPLVNAAKEAFGTLEGKDLEAFGDTSYIRRYLDQLDILRDQAAHDALVAGFVGSWKLLYGDSYDTQEFTLNEDLSCVIDGEHGTWDAYTYDNCFYASTDSGASSVGGLERRDYGDQARLSGSYGGTYVRAEDYDAIIGDMFVTVEISKDNFSEYFGDFVKIGDTFDEWGDAKGTAYLMPSAVYRDGLVLWSCSDDFAVEYNYVRDDGTRYGKWDSTGTLYTPYSIIDTYSRDVVLTFSGVTRAKGSLTFIRSSYVEQNDIDSDGYRSLTLTDGTVYRDYTYSSYSWERTNARYVDWKY